MQSRTPDEPVMRTRTTGGPAYADAALQLIADGLTELVGFGSAVINIRRGDELEIVVATGNVAGSSASGAHSLQDMVGTRFPVTDLDVQLSAQPDIWGMWRFVPHERSNLEDMPGVFVPDMDDVTDDPGAWRPLDLLVALIQDDAEKLCGAISIDLPVNGRRPGPELRPVLERYAQQARRAVLLWLEHERLGERARDVAVVRGLLRDAGAGLSLPEVLRASQDALVRGLAADSLYLEARTADGGLVTHASERLRWTASARTVEVGRVETERLWAERTYAVISRHTIHGDPRWGQYAEDALRFLDAGGADSALIVPIGADHDRMGHFVLLRDHGRPAWTEAEGLLALELGQDLGRLALTSNAYTHERDLADELRTADSAHSHVIDAVARELRGPLAALSTGLTALAGERRERPGWYQQLESLLTRSDQLDSIVSGLLLYSRAADPGSTPRLGYVNLADLVEEVCRDRMAETLARGITGLVDTPRRPVYVMGERSELRAAILHLIDNALVYTHRGGEVTVSLRDNGVEVSVTVVDTGVGIPEDEQPYVFDEFYRGSAPAVGGANGAGLGLTIVRLVARRHDGRVTLRSRPGAGTRAAIVLPLAYDASAQLC